MNSPALTSPTNPPRDWAAAQVADACLRVGLPLRCAPPGLRPVCDGMAVAGPVRPVRHFGSVDVFLESMLPARAGEVLVIDNGARLDEGCIGDLTVLEAKATGLAGVIVWGAHRDTAELRAIGLPVFTYGRHPAGPVRLDAREEDCFRTARFGTHSVTEADYVFADGDGAVFVPAARVDEVLQVARSIRATERAQAAAVANGRLLREQFQLERFLAERAQNPQLTFRQHLQRVRAEIEA